MNFVRLKRAKWEPYQSSLLCSEHFKREDSFRSADLGDEKNHRTSFTTGNNQRLGSALYAITVTP